MLIALDYDGTYTEDPEMWNAFVLDARTRGHKVYCITMRFKREGAEVEAALSDKVDKIIYTDRKAKKPSVWLQCGEYPNIWIDDIPEFINASAAGWED